LKIVRSRGNGKGEKRILQKKKNFISREKRVCISASSYSARIKKNWILAGEERRDKKKKKKGSKRKGEREKKGRGV